MKKIIYNCESCGNDIKKGENIVIIANISKYYKHQEIYCQNCNELNLSDKDIKNFVYMKT